MSKKVSENTYSLNANKTARSLKTTQEIKPLRNSQELAVEDDSHGHNDGLDDQMIADIADF